MGRPSWSPTVEDILALRAPHDPCTRSVEGDCQRGHSMAAIARACGVTPQAIYDKLRRVQAPLSRPRYAAVLPWRVATAHEQAWDAHMLRELGKRLAGEPEGQRGAYLDRWLADLDARREVIDYSPETGFSRVPREKRDGDGYIRQPEVAPE